MGKLKASVLMMALSVSANAFGSGYQFVQSVSGLKAAPTGPSEADIENWKAVWDQFAVTNGVPGAGSGWFDVPWGFERLTTVPQAPYPNEDAGDLLFHYNNFTETSFLSNVKTLNVASFYGTPVSDLSGLANLERVERILNIGGTGNFSDVSVLSNLRYVGEALNFHCSTGLADLRGFAGIEYVGSAVRLPRGIQSRPEFQPIPASSWLCQAGNAGLFPGGEYNNCPLATQSEVCE